MRIILAIVTGMHGIIHLFGFFKAFGIAKFVAMCYKDVEENSKSMQWTVSATKTEVRNGINIPVELNVSWKLYSGDWTWLKVKINDILYNLEKMPVLNKGYTQ